MSRAPDLPATEPRPGRLPIVLSAIICPGLGQCVQGRRLPGGLLLTSAAVVASWLAFVVLRFAIGTGGAVLAFFRDQPNRDVPTLEPTAVLVPLGIFLLIYVVSLVDVVRAYVRDRRRWSMNRHLPFEPDGSP